MASSSASSYPASVSAPEEFRVFLSFRGKDTRNNFTSHLYASLVQNNIKTFIDDVALERGDEISRALKEAIERSKLAIIVFSENYASSSWCLEELVHILKCREKNNQIVVPVFYHVDPSDLQYQRGSFAAGFAKHEERFEGNIGKVTVWRDALSKAADFSGWDSRDIRSESELVNKIVEDVSEKLNRIPSSNYDCTGFVGIERRFEKIEDYLLPISSVEVCRVIGIWGTGGIGKTTLARILFHRLSTKFEGCYFIEDIRIDWENGQKKYYDSKNILFYHKHLRNKRVLVVLDNVNNPEQLEILAEDLFGPGSRIIITSRDMQMLRGKVDSTYEVEKLDSEESVQLFHSVAPREINMHDIVNRIISYANGIPLALRVLGSFLRGKRLENWEGELNKLKDCPNKKIISILRTSYEGLDEMQKCIFLDVACFFKNASRDDVERILDACCLHPKVGLDDLIDKSLVSINIYNKVNVHDLIQQMAWSIVNSSEKIETRSRLWIPQDSCQVLETNKGTRAIEGIFLDMSKISDITFHSAAFQDTNKLRLLKIFRSDVRKSCQVSTSQGNRHLYFLPSSLTYLHWEEFPWKSFPPNFRPQNLVELNLPFSEVEELWKGSQALYNLIKIDVSHSKNLAKLPDLSRASKLEHLYLENCTRLHEVPSSIQNLGQFKTLIANGCSSMSKFPELPKSIVCVVLSGTSIKQVPESIRKLDFLEILNLSGCGNLVCVPSISTVPSLKVIMLPYSTVSGDKNSWINQVFKRGGSSLQEYDGSRFETSHVSQIQVASYVKARIRDLSETKLLVELPLYRYDFSDRASSVAAVSIPLSVLKSHLANGSGHHQSQNLVFFNCLDFYGGNTTSAFGEELFMEHSRRIVFSEFAGALPLEANIGYCCPKDDIPLYFFPRSVGDMVDVSFPAIPGRQVSRFLLCTVINFSSYRSKEQTVYEDGCKEFEVLCEPYFTSTVIDFPADDNNLRFNKVENWSNGTRSRDISKASFRFWVGPPDEENNFGAKVIKCGVNVIWDESEIMGLSGNKEEEDDQVNYGYEVSEMKKYYFWFYLTNLVKDKKLLNPRHLGEVKGISNALMTNSEDEEIARSEEGFGVNTYTKPPLMSYMCFVYEALHELTIVILALLVVLSTGLYMKVPGANREGWINRLIIFIAIKLIVIASAMRDFRIKADSLMYRSGLRWSGEK